MKLLFTAFSRKILFILSFLIFSFYSFAYTPIDFNNNAAQNIDARITSKHATVNKPIFSLQDHTNGIYTRNPNCWASDLDLTCLSPWNLSSVNLRAGTLITPRHCILAAHFILRAGDSIRFVTKDNVTIRRKIIAHKVNTDWNAYKPDIEIITLDSDVPNTITPCQFLPSNYVNYIANDGKGLPVLYTDQEEKALALEVMNINLDKRFELQGSNVPNRTALSETVISGDSGNPIFLVLNDKLVVFGFFTYGGFGSGNALTHYANLPNGGTQPEQNLNDLIVAADASVGINTGYKITMFDFLSTAIVPLKSMDFAQIQVVNHILSVKFKEITSNSSVRIFMANGIEISHKNQVSQNISCILPTNGIYFINVIQGEKFKTYKIIVQ